MLIAPLVLQTSAVRLVDVPAQFLRQLVISCMDGQNVFLLTDLHYSGQRIFCPRPALGILDRIQYFVFMVYEIATGEDNDSGGIVVVHTLACRTQDVFSDHAPAEFAGLVFIDIPALVPVEGIASRTNRNLPGGCFHMVDIGAARRPLPLLLDADFVSPRCHPDLLSRCTLKEV